MGDIGKIGVVTTKSSLTQAQRASMDSSTRDFVKALEWSTTVTLSSRGIPTTGALSYIQGKAKQIGDGVTKWWNSTWVAKQLHGK